MYSTSTQHYTWYSTVPGRRHTSTDRYCRLVVVLADPFFTEFSSKSKYNKVPWINSVTSYMYMYMYNRYRVIKYTHKL